MFTPAKRSLPALAGGEFGVHAPDGCDGGVEVVVDALEERDTELEWLLLDEVLVLVLTDVVGGGVGPPDVVCGMH